MTARVLEDCVVETSTTTGTGDFTLAGAVTGFKSFSQVCSVGDSCYYMIEAIDANGNRTGEWETGLGTYSGASNLTRTTVHNSSNADAAVSFSAGTKRVMIAKTSTSFDFRGVSATKSADQTGLNVVAAAASIAWDSEAYDTNAFHDNVTNNSRLTIPADMSYVRVLCCVRLANVTASNGARLTILKNGTTTMCQMSAGVATFTNVGLFVASGVIPVVAGDYFEAQLQIGTDTSVDITAQGSFFNLEVVQ